MSKTNARCARQRTHANEPPAWVAEFTHDLLVTGHTALTVRRYDAVARHLAYWLEIAEVAVAGNAQLLREVIVAETERVSRAHVKTMITALRSLLRFPGQWLSRPTSPANCDDPVHGSSPGETVSRDKSRAGS
jgi:hypothetical protein